MGVSEDDIEELGDRLGAVEEQLGISSGGGGGGDEDMFKLIVAWILFGGIIVILAAGYVSYNIATDEYTFLELVDAVMFDRPGLQPAKAEWSWLLFIPFFILFGALMFFPHKVYKLLKWLVRKLYHKAKHKIRKRKQEKLFKQRRR